MNGIHKNVIVYYDSRYKFSAKELDSETNYSYFGARYYDSDLSNWLSCDPASDARPNLSPYNYCQWNPVGRIDPNGALDHNYSIDEQGNIKLEEKTNDKFDVIYRKSDYDKGNLKNGLKVNDQSILSQLKNGSPINREDANGDVYETGTFRFATSKNKNEILKVFKFSADNSNKEWISYFSKDGYAAIGTYQFNDLSPSSREMNMKGTITKMIHSHPNPTTLAGEKESLYGDRFVAQRTAYKYYIYMRNSSNLYKINNQNGSSLLMFKKIDFNSLSNIFK